MRLTRSNLKKIFLLGFALIFLSGCQNFQASSFSVMPVQSSQVGLAAFQQIEVLRDDKYQRFEAAIEFTQAKMTLVILSELSQHLATVSIEDGRLELVRQGVFSSPVPVDYLAQGLQYIFWPMASVEQFFLDSEWSIIARAQRREFYFRGKLASYVDYDTACPWVGGAEYVDILNNYKVIVKSTLLGIEASSSYVNHCPF